MPEEEKSKKRKYGLFENSLVFSVRWLLVIGLLYVGGWFIVWKKPLQTNESMVFSLNYPPPININLFEEEESLDLPQIDGFAIRYNDLFYGAMYHKRWFDSPILSWICLLTAAGAFRYFRA